MSDGALGPDDVLTFCFPQGLDASLERHVAFWQWMMRGGSDAGIRESFVPLWKAAVAGLCEPWASTPRGRLALILVLDQFSRSIARGSAQAFAQDARALMLAETGLANGHFDALQYPWERTLFALPLVHAEGPDHARRVARNELLAVQTLALAPEPLKPAYGYCLEQSRRHRAVIDTFGRHPHRNAALGRASTPAEQQYLEAGVFPHEHDVKVTGQP